ncbi:hypothetical protein H5410_017248 [Solanum commersonii]|uniref:Uncharacterized protein n=1 Tax=Solanum commersonii TaxID=4109 RepID=A0A9J5ZYW7_SOLCO|nr:hypothetical protein H5410_017248 [Solanum commersonii]
MGSLRSSVNSSITKANRKRLRADPRCPHLKEMFSTASLPRLRIPPTRKLPSSPLYLGLPIPPPSPLWPPKLPLDTPKTFEATFLMQLTALFHMASASPLPLQAPIPINFSPISRERAGVKPPHLILGRSNAIFFLLALLISRSITKSLCWVIWLVSGDKQFAGAYLAFAGVGCSPKLLSVVHILAGAKETRERSSPFAGRSWSSRSFWPAQPSLAGSEAAPGCRIGSGARLPAGFCGCSLTGAGRCFA